jgi:excisionase family DNA binding protein
VQRQEINNYDGGPSEVSGDQLLTVFEAATFARCNPETIRRAYLANHLRRVRLGARGVRIRLRDLLDWLEKGGKTRR